MGCFGVLLGAGTAWWLWHGGNTVAACIAAALALISYWSFGVMHNYATEAAKRRSGYEGGFSDFTAREVDEIPNWIGAVNLAATIAVVACAAYAGWQTFG